MRGMRRGSGVRTRGGRGVLGGPAVVVEVIDMLTVDDRGGLIDVEARLERQSFRTIDDIIIHDIRELPEGRGLETPLREKRRRNWQPGMDSGIESPPASPMRHRIPVSPRTPRLQREDDISFLANCGSDSDSDDDDEETSGVVPVIIPRVYKSLMETPLDEDAAEEPAPATNTVPEDLEPADVLPKMTQQPRDLYDFEWRDFPTTPIPPEWRREAFSESNVGPTTPCADPYEIFIQIWDQQFMEYIASETNKYAQQVVSGMLENHSLRPTSRICHWQDTNASELYVYFALILAMGVVVKTRIEEYWGSSPDVFYTPGFSAHMSIDRFLLLSKCLHFNDNEEMCALGLEYSEARLFKIQPVLSHLNRKFQEMYRPAQNLALDESLLMWKGWLEFSQLIPNKVANRGIKTYEICESQTGYLWRFEVHARKKQSPQQVVDPFLEAATPATVLRLVKGLEHKGYTLWMDSFYQSPCLARRLKCLGFDCVGTLRTDRKFVPRALNSLTRQNMRQGQIAGLTSGDVDVMVWRDNNRVAMISTYHGYGQQTVRGSTKPILIHDYNIMMGGVDKKDQLLAMYPIERKRTKVWYKKFFKRLLNTSVLNSFIIHRQSSSSALTHRNFRYMLIRDLLAKHATPWPVLPLKKFKADVSHRLGEYPMRSHQRLRRACASCKRLVRTFCVGCDRAVCMDPCFVKIHS
ncbi:hypothetical protein PYW07_011752 [Mythimna separata]|uniref:PiggyBac transposable element-derived protein domain-containing protein n=1 Tax=Mythimna separata TaxID=271217 RepID=A0AAD7Y716_MYTSE|nr:hypothetical protein PYW07_011752 [Mythimna separata]